MIAGTEWLVDATGCDSQSLRDIDLLRSLFQRLITDLQLQVIGEMNWHRFPPPGGITGFALLSESHLTCHTYPEYGLATINLYCCRERPQWRWSDCLREMLGATNIKVRAVERAVIREEIMLENSNLVAVARQP